MAEGIPARLTTKEGRDFAFSVGGAFTLLSGVAFWRHHPVSWRVFASLAAALFMAGALVPRSLGPVSRAWMGFAHVLSKITTPIFMAVIYFVILTPMGLVMRLFGRNAMRHEATQDSFWTDPPSGGRSDMEHQF
ncbi:MAG: SxtJ family membrane protein [Gemmatimonadota bacterium]|nr:SxtJ family membrane protein [Gemmatimonadota bacterium]